MSDLVSRAPQEAELVRLIRAGSEDGLRALLANVGGPTKVALSRKYPDATEDQIDSAISDATLAMWRDVDRFDAKKGSLGGFFYTTARNGLVSDLRAQAARPLFEQVGAEHLANASIDSRPGRSERLERLLCLLRDCIAALSPMQQDIILSDLANDSSRPIGAELAERWETTTNAIRVARSRAHRRLSDLLEERVEDESGEWGGEGS